MNSIVWIASLDSACIGNEQTRNEQIRVTELPLQLEKDQMQASDETKESG